MKDKHPIDDYFKEGLVGYKSKPSAGVWQKIEAQTQSRHRRGNLWYLGRAAVVLLLVGMGNWWQFNHGLEETAITNISGSWPSETIAGPGDKKKEKPEEEKKADEPEKKQQPNRKKAMPIMRSPVNARPIYVQNIHVPELDDEKALYPLDEEPLATVELASDQIKSYQGPKLKLKVHLSNPVSQAAFYTEDSTTTAPKGLGQKLYAYANDQWDNIKQGRPVEFPKAKSPQLSINIDKILPN